MQKRKVGNRYFWGPGDASPDGDVPIFGGGRDQVPATKQPSAASRTDEKARLFETLKDVMTSEQDAKVLANRIERRGQLE